VDLSSVTAIGVAAFTCFKFVGYLLSFHLIKRFHPQIQASAIVMSVARTVLGMIVGGARFILPGTLHATGSLAFTIFPTSQCPIIWCSFSCGSLSGEP